MSELDALKVYGETRVGWCRLTPPNETVDEHGNPSAHSTPFNAPDPRARRNHQRCALFRVNANDCCCAPAEALRTPAVPCLTQQVTGGRSYFRDSFEIRVRQGPLQEALC
jgi:hypothetical protein